jgi:NhaP-type Na+/H+ or K+/H+ antiporter
MSETAAIVLITFAACWTAAAAFVWILVRSVSRGVWYWHRLKVIRDEQPFTFWVGPAGYAAMAALLFWFPLNVASWFH